MAKFWILQYILEHGSSTALKVSNGLSMGLEATQTELDKLVAEGLLGVKEGHYWFSR